jgi:5-methylcytosine-specific restriction endonuclease McrA
MKRDFRGHAVKAAIPHDIRRAVARRHGAEPGTTTTARCRYCGADGVITWFVGDRGEGWVHFADLELEHITPEHIGGATSADNIDLACRSCNRSKGHKTEQQWLEGVA